MSRLRVRAGPSPSELKPLRPNTGDIAEIASDVFEGKVAVYIKGYDSGASNTTYFEHEDRKEVTWSIQVQGRFLQECNADDVLFGVVFDKPLALPWGFSTILSFMKYKDPTLKQDLTSQSRPWALSPFISSMPYLAHAPASAPHAFPSFPSKSPLKEDILQMKFQDNSTPEELKDNDPLVRRGYFKEAVTRTDVKLGPEDVITADCCHGHLTFTPSGIALQLPGGFSLDITKFWQGHPVCFVCCERAPEKGDDGQPFGRIFWCVKIELVEEDASEDDESTDNDVDDAEGAEYVDADEGDID